MSRENEKQKSGNAFINALKKSNMTAMAAILVVMIIIASIVSPYFLNVYNLQSVLRDLAFVGMIGIAQSLLLLVGELDLSVGKIACLSGILTGMLMVNVGLNPWLCLVIGLILGLLFGFINGIIITRLRLNSMVATIGMQGVYGGINLVITKGKAVTGIPADTQALGKQSIGPIPIPFIICRHAVDMGFTSVMYDASAKPFEDNVAETRSVVEYAHERGASVEAELGHILTSKAGAAEGNGKSYTREEAYTDPEMAKEFIERTNVDALAIGFGTAHGIYTEKPVLDLNRIALIKSAKDIPYVMHGGSGLSEEEYRTAIHNGIRKINYYTYLSLAGGRGVMQYLEDKKHKDAIYFEDIAKAGITAMKADVKRAMKIFESDGKI